MKDVRGAAIMCADLQPIPAVAEQHTTRRKPHRSALSGVQFRTHATSPARACHRSSCLPGSASTQRPPQEPPRDATIAQAWRRQKPIVRH